MCAPRRLLVPAILGMTVALWAAADAVTTAAQAQAPTDQDLVIGVWRLNPAKSNYVPGPAPKSQTRTYEPHADGIKATIETVYSDGRKVSVQYVADYDSIEYPVTGSPDADAITLKKLDALTAEATLMHGGKVYGVARRVISKDGKTMTITFRTGDGNTNNVSVYEKK
jgi:hypothetical protein